MSESPIQAAAAAALAAQRAAEAAFREELRDALVSVACTTLSQPQWAPLDVDALTVAHADLDNYLVVLTDGTTALAVYDDGRVFLVTDTEGWTRGPQVESLAELALVL